MGAQEIKFKPKFYTQGRLTFSHHDSRCNFIGDNGILTNVRRHVLFVLHLEKVHRLQTGLKARQTTELIDCHGNYDGMPPKSIER